MGQNNDVYQPQSVRKSYRNSCDIINDYSSAQDSCSIVGIVQKGDLNSYYTK